MLIHFSEPLWYEYFALLQLKNLRLLQKAWTDSLKCRLLTLERNTCVVPCFYFRQLKTANKRYFKKFRKLIFLFSFLIAYCSIINAMLIFMVQPRRFQDTKIHLDFKETLITIKFLLIRVGPDVRQRRIIRSDIRYLARKSRIIRHIRQYMPDNPLGYPVSERKNRSGPILLFCQTLNCI